MLELESQPPLFPTVASFVPPYHSTPTTPLMVNKPPRPLSPDLHKPRHLLEYLLPPAAYHPCTLDLHFSIQRGLTTRRTNALTIHTTPSIPPCETALFDKDHDDDCKLQAPQRPRFMLRRKPQILLPPPPKHSVASKDKKDISTTIPQAEASYDRRCHNRGTTRSSNPNLDSSIFNAINTIS